MQLQLQFAVAVAVKILLLLLLCVAWHSRRQSKTRRAACMDAGRFSSGQGCPV
ncbi:hypothetical protein GLA29479_4193 [Lysobacter antibioticus]|nr:hypothetical protein GLA29479_4193 [Lysobacter antibioticus]